LLKTIACYGVVFEGLTDEGLAEFVQTTAMDAPGYDEYCRHQHEIGVRSMVWARAAQKYWWALGSNPRRTRTADESKVIPINKNQLRAEDAQRRIREVVDRLVAAGQFPIDATGRSRVLIREARTSQQTLYRYPELWHPEHREDDRTGSVIAEVAGDAGISVEEIPQEPESPESRQGGELHTLEERMKGERGLDGDCRIEIPVNETTSATMMEFKRFDREENEWIEKPLEKSLSTIELRRRQTEVS
jgi:hypothetical protein